MMYPRIYGPLLASVLLVTGCAEPRLLMPTPNLYADEKAILFEAVPQEYANVFVELIYVTDRAPAIDEAGKVRYGHNRSNSLAIGTTVVNLGQNVTWEELVDASQTQTRFRDFELSLVSIDEFARLPPTPTPYKVIDGKVVEDPDVVAARDRRGPNLLRR